MDLKGRQRALPLQWAADQSARGGEVARRSYGCNRDDDSVFMIQVCFSVIPGSRRLSCIAGYLNAAELVAPERWYGESLGRQTHDGSCGSTRAAFRMRPGLLPFAGYASDIADREYVRMDGSVTLIN